MLGKFSQFAASSDEIRSRLRNHSSKLMRLLMSAESHHTGRSEPNYFSKLMIASRID